MPIRAFAPLAFLFAASLLAGCDSSGSSPTSSTTPTHPTESGHAPNGTLKANGISYPAFVAAIYDDTSMTLTVVTDLVNGDTGWNLVFSGKPSQGTQDYAKDGEPSLTARYAANGSDKDCWYVPESGDLRIGSWVVNPSGQYQPAAMDGGASLALVPRSDINPCPNTTIELTFANAIALIYK